jgi:hypothetical protein
MTEKPKRFQSPYKKLSEESDRLRQRMKECRMKLGYTQVEMAAVMEVSRETYIRWERSGPPTTKAHHGYVAMMVRKLLTNHASKKHYQEKRRAME